MKKFALHKKDDQYLRFLEETQKSMEEKIQTLCWDKDRFIRGYTESGDRIGAAEDYHGKCP